MKKNLKNIIFFLVLALIIPNIANAQPREAEKEYQADRIFLEEVLDLIKKDYYMETKEDELIITGVKAMLNSLDPYSDYYTKEEAEKMFTSLNGNFSGIGVYISEKDGYISVEKPIKNGPAEKVGVKAGDLIVSVNGENIRGMTTDEASDLIKGPTGTMVKIGVLRGRTELIFNVKRENIEINPVEYEIMEGNIGYIMLTDFSYIATKEIKKALSEFDSKKVGKVILDLRDNPGGYLDQAISIGKLFVPKGPIVHVRGKDKNIKTYNSELNKLKYELVVLVNENSASASEIVAGAIKDTKAGKLVGTKTFGKATVQNLIELNDGSLIKLTTATYLTPNKNMINKVGIEPDYKVENTGIEDLQLMKALELLR